MSTRPDASQDLFVVTLSPLAPDIAAALAARCAPMPLRVLPVLAAGSADPALVVEGAGTGERIKAGLLHALAASPEVIAIVPELTAAAVAPLAELAARVRSGVADIAFALPADARAGIAERAAARLLHCEPGSLGWAALAARPAALRALPFLRNDDGDGFAAELALQVALADLRSAGARDAAWRAPRVGTAALIATLKARAQSLHIFYDRRFDIAARAPPPYELKVGYKTPHTVALAAAAPGSRVLDLGAADGYVARLLAERGCFVTAVDRAPPASNPGVPFVVHDLDRGPPDVDYAAFDLVLMLDVVEHLRDPEAFMDALAARMGRHPGRRLLLSTGNVGFIVVRLMLLAGQFNYGRRGILDLTHTRLFTRGTLERMLRQCGFRILARDAAPVPVPAAIGRGAVARALLAASAALARLLPRLFAYQIIVVAEPAARLAALPGQESSSRTDRSP